MSNKLFDILSERINLNRTNRFIFIFCLLLIFGETILVWYQTKAVIDLIGMCIGAVSLPITIILGVASNKKDNTDKEDDKEDSEEADGLLFYGAYNANGFFDRDDGEKWFKDKRRYIFKRDVQCQEFIQLIESNKKSEDSTGFVFLTGKSGSGKSTLLSLINYNNMDKYSFHYYFTGYAQLLSDRLDDILEEVSKDKFHSIVVFDQFENILPFLETNKNKLNDFISKLPYETTIIFSFIEERLLNFLKIFNINDISSQVYSMGYTKNDKDLIRKNLEDAGNVLFDELGESCSETDGTTIQDKAKRDIYNYLMRKVNRNEIPMVAVQVLGNIMEISYTEKLKNIVQQNRNKYSNIFDCILFEYLNVTLSELNENHIIGKAVLFALSLHKDDFECLKKKDFKLITFKDEQIIRNVIKLFVKKKLIKRMTKKSQEDSSQFKIMHEYIAEKIAVYCNTFLNPSIAASIRHFYVNKFPDEDSNSETNNKKPAEYYCNLEKKYTDYNENSRAPVVLLVFCIAVFCAASLVFCINQINSKAIDLFTFYYIIMLNLLCGLSFYYMYNYCVYFLMAYSKKFISVMIIDLILVVLLFLYPDYWVFCFATAIILVAISRGIIQKNIGRKTKEAFNKNFGTFLGVGLLGIVMGLWYLLLPGKTDAFILLSFIYLVFIVLATTIHISQEYLLFAVGKTNIESSTTLHKSDKTNTGSFGKHAERVS